MDLDYQRLKEELQEADQAVFVACDRFVADRTAENAVALQRASAVADIIRAAFFKELGL